MSTAFKASSSRSGHRHGTHQPGTEGSCLSSASNSERSASRSESRIETVEDAVGRRSTAAAEFYVGEDRSTLYGPSSNYTTDFSTPGEDSESSSRSRRLRRYRQDHRFGSPRPRRSVQSRSQSTSRGIEFAGSAFQNTLTYNYPQFLSLGDGGEAHLDVATQESTVSGPILLETPPSYEDPDSTALDGYVSNPQRHEEIAVLGYELQSSNSARAHRRRDRRSSCPRRSGYGRGTTPKR